MSRQPYRRRLGLCGVKMPTHNVNLDALIVREDLEVTSENPDNPGGSIAPFSIEGLIQGQSLHGVLRKPDFQRETAGWNPEQIVNLVKNFLDEELIPSLILWKAPNRNIFVIDGAHRLSALIAWVNDDYGDNPISEAFFGKDNIPAAQRKAAKVTRDLIKEEVGHYADLKKYIQNPEGAGRNQLLRARNIPSVLIPNQTVRNDAAHAEASFYRINQGGAVIDALEGEIIWARGRPEALAARAILRSGTGHKYWWRFDASPKKIIEDTAKEIYALLYSPDLEDEMRMVELPMAGTGYAGTALGVLYELIHVANDIDRVKTTKKRKQSFDPLPANDPRRDSDGTGTIEFLSGVKRLAQTILSSEPCSLGLHPGVYSYSATGKFQPAAFLAQVVLIKRIVRDDRVFEFTKARARFEEFLVRHKFFINQIVVGFGSLRRALTPLVELESAILDAIIDGATDEEVRAELLKKPTFGRYLKDMSGVAITRKPNFSKETKAGARLRAKLDSAPKCPICGARMHPNSDSIDHIKRKEDGGIGDLLNAQATHPYCNTGYKEKQAKSS